MRTLVIPDIHQNIKPIATLLEKTKKNNEALQKWIEKEIQRHNLNSLRFDALKKKLARGKQTA